MATVLPPPSKRQKIESETRARELQERDVIPNGLGNVRIQFVDQATGKPTAAPVQISVANATVKNLELLLNTLQGQDDPADQIPYQFAFQTEAGALDITSDIYRSLLRSGTKTTEDLISLQYTPQAIFRVRAVSRCFSAISGHGEPILATYFSPLSSSRMVSGSGDATARIWDCDTGTPLYTLKGHESWVLAVSWSPDDSTIATGSYDNTVRLWNANTGEAFGPALKGHTRWVTALAWEPYHLQQAGRPRLASSSKDATVRIWDAVSHRIDMTLSCHKGTVSCVKWGGTGNIYTASHDKTIKIWSSSTGSLILTLNSHSHWVNHLALSTDFVLRTAYHDHTGSANIPSTTESKIKKARQRFEKAATVNGHVVEKLISASDDYTIYLWTTAGPGMSTKPTVRLHGHQKQVNHVTFSPDTRFIASASFDNSVKLWSARDGTFLHTLRGHVAPVYQVCFSPDSRLLVSCSKDTTLKAWDVAKGVLKEDLPGHADEVYAVDWAPDGKAVGSGGKDRQVRIWKH